MMYHYGITIREGREAAHMTQAQLAEKWPQADGGTGVSAKNLNLRFAIWTVSDKKIGLQFSEHEGYYQYARGFGFSTGSFVE